MDEELSEKSISNLNYKMDLDWNKSLLTNLRY